MKSLDRVVLTIAASDPTGAAGIQADLKTFAAHGCYGTSALTALAGQSTAGAQGVHPCPPEFVEQQVNLVLSDLNVSAIKTGMLHSAETVKAVVKALESRYHDPGSMPPIVCDPVCVSTSSGHAVLHEDALKVMIAELCPVAWLITLNKLEAELLLSQLGVEHQISSLEDMLIAAEKLLDLGSQAVLVKGGHIVASMEDIRMISEAFPDTHLAKQVLYGDNMEVLLAGHQGYKDPELVVDVLQQKNGRRTTFVRPRIESFAARGKSCTLSSAIACELAKGCDLENAVEKATMYTHLGIQAASPIGKGHGPLEHSHTLTQSLIPLRTPTTPYPFAQMLIERTSTSWKEYVEHDFVKQLGKGVLARESFVHFIRQDYLYLKYYARAYGLLAAKSSSFDTIKGATQTILNILHEVGNHRAFCATFDITHEELERTPESSATTAYGAYLIDTGLQGDAAKLTMALMACLVGYGEVGLWLMKESIGKYSWVVLEGNPYQHWINEYAGEGYQSAVRVGLEAMEEMALADPPSPTRLEEWRMVWERCTKLEKGFWDMAMEAGKTAE